MITPTLLVAPEPLRRRLVLGPQAIVCLRARLPHDLRRDRFEAAARSCVARFDAFRITPRAVPGVATPMLAMDEMPELQLTWGGRMAPMSAAPLTSPWASPRLEMHVGSPGKNEVGERDRVFILRAPARCLDRPSLRVFMRRLAAALAGDDFSASPDEVSYVDVAEWLQQLTQSVEGSRGKLYWRRGLVDDALDAAPVESGDAGLRLEACVKQPMPRGFERLTPEQREASAALAWLQVAQTMTGNPHLAIGCLADGRLEEGLRDAVGPLSRFVPLALREPRQRAREALARVADRLAEGRQWQELFLIDDFSADRFSHAFEYHHALAPAEIPIDEIDTDDDRHDVLLRCEERGRSLQVLLRTRDSHLTFSQLDGLRERWTTALARSVETPERPLAAGGILTLRERRELPWRGPVREIEGTLLDAFRRICASAGDRTAVSCMEQELSFAALDALSTGLAARLPVRNTAEQVIGLDADRSPALIVAILAILKRGAAFLPLSRRLPAARRQRMLDEAGVTLVISDRAPADSPWPGVDVWDVREVLSTLTTTTPAAPSWTPPPVHPDQPAYVLYTSGSTGAPVGAVIAHRAVLNLWQALQDAIPPLRARDLRIGMNGPISFDTSIKQLVQLLSGQTLVLIPEETRIDPPAFWSHVQREQIDVLDVTPSHLTRLLAAASPVQGPRALPQAVLLGGEAPPPQLWGGLPFAQAYNLYGLTECAVDSVTQRIEPAVPAGTLGQPLANTELFLTDAWLDPQPNGVSGELFIAGAGLARGYIGAPGRTAERFLPHPFGRGTRAFRTGDLAERRADGRIHPRGRRGSLVKVRGHRVSMTEVQAALEAQSGVAAAFVGVRESGPGHDSLIGWVVPTESRAATIDGLTRFPVGDLAIAGLNQHETAFLYGEVFERQAYLRHGLALAPGACVIDVGANIGMFSLQAHLAAPGVRIIAFEPHPEAYRCLLANARIFGIAGTFLPLALGSRAGQADFTSYAGFSILSGFRADRADDLAVVREYIRQHQPADGVPDERLLDELLADRFEAHRQRLAMAPLSELIARYGVERVDFLKINVEKSEAEVLDGIAAEHWPRIRQIALELHDVDGRLQQTLDRLRGHGFHVVAEKDWSLPGSASVNHYVYASRDPLLDNVGAMSVRRTCEMASPLTERELLQALTAQLPDYALPSRLVLLDRMPLTEHGKVDEAALDARLAERRAPDDLTAPRTMLERQLLGEWQQILDRGEIGVDTSFLEAGGDSFAIMQLNLRLRQTMSIELPVAAMFRYPSIRRLAEHIGALVPRAR